MTIEWISAKPSVEHSESPLAEGSRPGWSRGPSAVLLLPHGGETQSPGRPPVHARPRLLEFLKLLAVIICATPWAIVFLAIYKFARMGR